MTHDGRWRQLPTNHNHAALHCGATREYQVDSPSINVSLLEHILSRDGPLREGQCYEMYRKNIRTLDRLVHIRGEGIVNEFVPLP
jgi:hypothetical protein